VNTHTNILDSIRQDRAAKAAALEAGRHILRRQFAGHTTEQLSEVGHVVIEMLYARVSDAAADEAHDVVIGLQEGLAELVGALESGRMAS